MDRQDETIKKLQEVIQIEIDGMKSLIPQIGESFVRLVNECVKILDNGGKIVVTGVGKSGHIGRKISATLASTGSPSVFMHPVEAMHGDLGMLQEGDLLLALSYSGETHELTNMILPAKRLGVPVASFTGYPDSTLAKLSDIAIIGQVGREACPFNLAPTTTSTAHLVLGDALAMVLLDRRKFTKEQFGLRHPGGAIGRAVTMRVSDVMRTGEHLALVSPDTTVKDALLKMTSCRCGSVTITDGDQKLLGIFTDGDFRRNVDQDLQILTRPVREVMTCSPTSIRADALAVEILKIVEKRKIDDIVVVDDRDRVVGLVDIADLPGLKIM